MLLNARQASLEASGLADSLSPNYDFAVGCAILFYNVGFIGTII